MSAFMGGVPGRLDSRLDSAASELALKSVAV
jgi:hypothetical protein